MRIAYGVHGYGRGHAARAMAILPELSRRHDVLLLVGGDAWDALSGAWPVVRIPHMRYELNRRGRRSPVQTLRRNIPAIADLRVRGPGLQMVADTLKEFDPDVVLCDSCAWTHRAAAVLGIPRISFDHFAVLVHCRWPMAWHERIPAGFEAFCYRRLMGEPERIVIASFYQPPPRREGVEVVGPVLRDAVHDVSPSRGDYLMVYLSNGEHHYTPAVRDGLLALDCPVKAYGTGCDGREGNIEYRPPANREFLEDLAGSRAIFSTAGNQLISEAIYFHKPMLLLPEDSLEQKLNARAIERMGCGMGVRPGRVNGDVLAEFLRREDEFADNVADAPCRDGRTAAVETIERFAAELTASADG